MAASVDLTGHAALGGNWNLELASGSIEAGTAISAEQQTTWAGLLLAPTNEFQVNLTTPNNQSVEAEDRGSQQAVALDASGNNVVVWTSKNQDGEWRRRLCTAF